MTTLTQLGTMTNEEFLVALLDAGGPESPEGKALVESRARVRRYIDRGAWSPDCATCLREGPGAFMPRHTASEWCQSGKHIHCACSTCF